MIAYQPRLKPRDYQLEGLAKMANREAFALLMAMRTGKTKTLLDDFGRLELEGKVDDLLVIAPAGVYRTWVDQVEEHLSDDLRKRVTVHVWTSGKSDRNKGDRLALEGFLKNRDGPRVFLVNIEALSVATTGARVACGLFAKDRRIMIAVDESTIIKSPRAKRTKFVVDQLAPLARYRRILSGLPTPRSPLDVYCQFQFLDPKILGHSSFYSFQRRYAVTKLTDFGGKLRRPAEIVVGYRDADEIARIIEPYSFRVPFRPNIPPTYSFRDVSMTAEQARIYAELKEFATSRLSDQVFVTAEMVIVQMLRMHQVLCGFTSDEEGNVREIPETRTTELLELLDDYAGKAIVWCSYDYNVRKVAEALKKEFGPVARFWGGNLQTREEEEKQFKTQQECRFMVATPGAGGKGRTWDVADLTVYFSSTNNLEHRDQSEQRVQGVEKLRGCDYVDLRVPSTIEDKIIGALRNKIDMATLINGDNYKEWLI